MEDDYGKSVAGIVMLDYKVFPMKEILRMDLIS